MCRLFDLCIECFRDDNNEVRVAYCVHPPGDIRHGQGCCAAARLYRTDIHVGSQLGANSVFPMNLLGADQLEDCPSRSAECIQDSGR
jgi:hypothetical protein